MAKAKKAKQSTAAQNDGWIEETGTCEKFEFVRVGQKLTGELLTEKATKKFEGVVFTLRITTPGPNEGETVYFFGSADLTHKLSGHVGDEVSISFVGKEDTGKGNDMKVFKVMVRPVSEDSDE